MILFPFRVNEPACAAELGQEIVTVVKHPPLHRPGTGVGGNAAGCPGGEIRGGEIVGRRRWKSGAVRGFGHHRGRKP